MKRDEIVATVVKALQDKPVCRCYTGKSKWQEDAEVAYDTAFPLIRDMVWEEAMAVAEKVAQEKRDRRDKSDYPASQYGNVLHSELIGANDVLDALVWRRFVLGADEGA